MKGKVSYSKKKQFGNFSPVYQKASELKKPITGASALAHRLTKVRCCSKHILLGPRVGAITNTVISTI